MICAYSQCGKPFEPARANQKFHMQSCKESARNERSPVRRRRVRKGPVVTTAGGPVLLSNRGEAMSLARIRQAALWLKRRALDL